MVCEEPACEAVLNAQPHLIEDCRKAFTCARMVNRTDRRTRWIVNLERLYNIREGLSRADGWLPACFIEEAVPLFGYERDPQTGHARQSPEPIGHPRNYDNLDPQSIGSAGTQHISTGVDLRGNYEDRR